MQKETMSAENIAETLKRAGFSNTQVRATVNLFQRLEEPYETFAYWLKHGPNEYRRIVNMSLPPMEQIALQSEGGPFPSGVGGVSSKVSASIFVPSIAVPSRPPRSFWISQTYRPPSPPPSLSSPNQLANDEEHALYHGYYACSESTSAPRTEA